LIRLKLKNTGADSGMKPKNKVKRVSQSEHLNINLEFQAAAFKACLFYIWGEKIVKGKILKIITLS